MALLDQVADIALALLGAASIGPWAIGLRQSLYGRQIRLLGARRHPAHDQIMLHTLA